MFLKLNNFLCVLISFLKIEIELNVLINPFKNNATVENIFPQSMGFSV